ncbi:MAG: bifunctional phosphopantothenoylcysteine decarboxylase/phosphopantothenate--cysteine ligase CoaBC [Clostridia bacterium]|nr:bifunctional phosphopantothenoylcysteine decarboxylase/phosphopantothenate--cysteine ligase CoaBC [Clostridia bacterium]
MNLKGKTILIGVSGSIAAYKVATLVSMLKKQEAEVIVSMTENATNFINPITFETLTNNRCLVNTFDRNFEFNTEHISVAKKADLVVLAPATANVIGKIANGIADDMLTTTIMACNCKKLIAPAMNTNMYENPIVQDNIEKLKRFGYEIIEPNEGILACGDVGKGKMAEPEEILEYIFREIACEKDLVGKKVLVTAGPTIEKIDSVRYLSNFSTGKMGYALAKIAMLRGAEATLISGKTNINSPKFVKVINVLSAKEMFEAVKNNFEEQDIIIKAAAVADYRSKEIFDGKIKKKDDKLELLLERTDDILKYVGEHKTNQFVCGFSMETDNMIENSKEKLLKKNLDMIVANNLRQDGAGFGVDTNIVTIITQDEIQELEILSKEAVANIVIDNIVKKCK